MSQFEEIYVDFGDGPERVIPKQINGKKHFVSARREAERFDAAYRNNPAFDDPDLKNALLKLEARISERRRS